MREMINEATESLFDDIDKIEEVDKDDPTVYFFDEEDDNGEPSYCEFCDKEKQSKRDLGEFVYMGEKVLVCSPRCSAFVEALERLKPADGSDHDEEHTYWTKKEIHYDEDDPQRCLRGDLKFFLDSSFPQTRNIARFFLHHMNEKTGSITKNSLRKDAIEFISPTTHIQVELDHLESDKYSWLGGDKDIYPPYTLTNNAIFSFERFKDDGDDDYQEEEKED